MKKFKKNLSRTIFSSFFVFQFIVTTSFMPVVALANEEAKAEAQASDVSEVKEEKEVVKETKEEVSKEEPQKEEGSSVESEGENTAPENESEGSDTSEGSAESESVEVTSETEDANTQSPSPTVARVEGQFVDANLRVCKVVLDANGQIVPDVSLTYPNETFTVPVSGPTYSEDVVFNTNDFNSYTTTTFGFDEGAFDAKCQTIVVPMQIPDISFLSEYSYGEEISGGNYIWDVKYNDEDFNALVAYPFGATDFTQSDGGLLFTGNTTEGLQTTLLVVNKFVSEVDNSCDALPVYARVNLTDLPGWTEKVKNDGYDSFGTGNMAPNIFVGGSNPSPNEDGGDVYEPGEWFMVYDPDTGYINDPVLTSVDPGVAGLAVQRLNGSVRLILYGSHSQPAGNQIANREMANGFIEFSNDAVSVSSDVQIVSVFADVENPLENIPGSAINTPTNDYVNFTSTASNFKFVVTTHNDGAFTNYTHSIPSDEDCGGNEDEAPMIIVTPAIIACLETNKTATYNFMDGVSAYDTEDGNITDSVIFSVNPSNFNQPGTYTVTYNVFDSYGNFAGAERTITVKNDCKDGPGGGGNTAPVITIPKDSCIVTGDTGYNFSAGVTASDNEDGNITYLLRNNSADVAVFSPAGSTFTVEYKVRDSGNLITTEYRFFEVKDDCKGGPGGGDGYGSITVCKAVVLEGVGALTSEEQNELLGEFDFNVKFLAKPAHLDASFNEASVPADVSFQTPLTTQTNTFWNLPLECETRIDLPLGNYYYGQETISPMQSGQITWLTPKYNDFNTTGDYLNNFAYSGELFTANLNDDASRNTNADGHIVLTANVPDRILLVENTFKKDGGSGNDDEFTVIAKKIVCENESSLPNFGAGGPNMTATTASDWVDAHDDCELVDWRFEWAPYNTANPGDNSIGLSGGSWTPFTSSVNIPMSSGTDNDTKIWVREVMLDGYIPFTGVNTTENVSAEMYCHTDVLNYDNFDRVDNIVKGGVYNCVAWNVEKDNTGGGGDDEPSITFGDLACIADGTVSDFDFLSGVTATDSLGDAFVLNLTDNVTGEELVDFNTVGSYEVTYTFTDPFNFEVVTQVRTIVISDNCGSGGGGGGSGGGGGGGGSSSSGSVGGASDGEVLGASSCVQFTTYNRQGNSGGEIMALQVFLNEYMNAGLVVDGVYGRSTTQAVHDFQAFHWSEIIDPWTPPLSPNTTGWAYKTTRATINAIIKCPEAPVFLEDPATIFSITEVNGQKEFTDAQIAEVSQLLALAQILGASDASSVNSTSINSINSNTSSNIVYEK